MTSYELFKGNQPNNSYFQPVGCKYFVHNNGKNNLGKFDARSEEGIFVGYSIEFVTNTLKTLKKAFM